MNGVVKTITKRGLMAIAIGALAALLAPMAKASCGTAEAARKILANKPWSILRPALAQSAVEGAAADAGHAAGFDDALSEFNRRSLLRGDRSAHCVPMTGTGVFKRDR